MKEGWKKVKLGECCNLVGGGTPSKKNNAYYQGCIPWVTVGDMNVDYLQKTSYNITEKAVEESSTHIIPQGEVIIATRVGLGKVCILLQDSAINQDLKGIIPKDNNIDRKYLFYWFKSKSSFIIDNGVGATVQGVKLSFISDLIFTLPPLPEQQRIVEYLDSTFAEIDALKAKAAEEVANAKAMFDAALREEMTPKEGWKEKRLGEICNKITDGSHNPPKGCDHSEYLMLSSQNVQYGELTFNSVRYLSKEQFEVENKRTQVKPGDILLTIVGTIGRSTVISCLENITFQRSVAILKPKELVNSYFLMYYLWSLTEELNNKAQGAAQKGIYLKQLSGIKCSYPSFGKQQAIVARLDTLRALVTSLEQKYTKIAAECDALKQAILRETFE